MLRTRALTGRSIMPDKSNQRGFTLVEIMIVVAIIGLVAAVAIPNLIRARMNANEGAVKLDLRTFSTASETFRSTQNPPAYAANVMALTVAVPEYLDSSWNAPNKHGYVFNYQTNLNQYSMLASPLTIGQTANNSFCIDQGGALIGPNAGAQPGGGANGCVGGAPLVS